MAQAWPAAASGSGGDAGVLMFLRQRRAVGPGSRGQARPAGELPRCARVTGFDIKMAHLLVAREHLENPIATPAAPDGVIQALAEGAPKGAVTATGSSPFGGALCLWSPGWDGWVCLSHGPVAVRQDPAAAAAGGWPAHGPTVPAIVAHTKTEPQRQGLFVSELAPGHSTRYFWARGDSH